MAVIRWEPARELSMLQNEMNRLFGTMLDPTAANAARGTARWMPAIDLIEHDDAFVLHADLPGMDDDDISIEVQDDVLTLSGTRSSTVEQRGEGRTRIERASGSFTRSLGLPDGVDPEQITARFDRGVLEVRIPKPEQRRPRRVTISTSSRGDGSAIEGVDTSRTAEPKRSTGGAGGADNQKLARSAS